MISQPLKIVIADDNPYLCDALKDYLDNYSHFDVKATFCSINELIKFTNNSILDVLILDINFNGTDSLDYIKQIKSSTSKFKIISLTTLNNDYFKNKAIEQGADSFVGKDLIVNDISYIKEVILNCFNNSKSTIKENFKLKIGNQIFTKRNIKVLQALYKCPDKNEEELSKILHISKSSLKSHKQKLFEITNTKNTIELIKHGIQKGLIIP